MTEWLEGEHDGLDLGERRWPLAPADLLPRERWLWWEQLWSDVLMLGNRYRLRPGKDWWEDGKQVEALAALAACHSYDLAGRQERRRLAKAPAAYGPTARVEQERHPPRSGTIHRCQGDCVAPEARRSLGDRVKTRRARGPLWAELALTVDAERRHVVRRAGDRRSRLAGELEV